MGDTGLLTFGRHRSSSEEESSMEDGREGGRGAGLGKGKCEGREKDIAYTSERRGGQNLRDEEAKM